MNSDVDLKFNILLSHLVKPRPEFPRKTPTQTQGIVFTKKLRCYDDSDRGRLWWVQNAFIQYDLDALRF